MNVPTINPYNNQRYYNIRNISLRSNHDSNERIQKKREYIDSKMDGLFDFGTVLLVTGLVLDGANNSMSKKRTTKQKIGFGFLCAAATVCIITIIKRISLSLNYKEEGNENDK